MAALKSAGDWLHTQSLPWQGYEGAEESEQEEKPDTGPLPSPPPGHVQ